MKLGKKFILLGFIFFNIIYHDVKATEIIVISSNHVTLRNCALIFGAGIVAFGIYKAIPIIKDFYDLVQKERIQQKVRTNRRKKLYERVEFWFDKPGVSVLDKLYELKKKLAQKLAMKVVAAKVASLLPE